MPDSFEFFRLFIHPWFRGVGVNCCFEPFQKFIRSGSVTRPLDWWLLKPSSKCVLFWFLSDPSPIIGYACHSLTHWLTICRLVNLIDVTLACKDGNSKLVEVVTVADVDDVDRVGKSLLQIWKLRFGHKAFLLFRLWAQGLVKSLKLKFGQYFAADV